MFCLSLAVHNAGHFFRHGRPVLGTRWRVLGEGWYPFRAKDMDLHPRFPLLALLGSRGQVAVVRLTDGSVHRLPGEGWGKPFWNPVYPLLAVRHRNRHTWGVYDIEKGKWLHLDGSSAVFPPKWLPDGDALLVFEESGRGWMFPVLAGGLHPPHPLPSVPHHVLGYNTWVLNGRALFWQGDGVHALLLLRGEKRRVISGERWWVSRDTSTGVRLQDGSLEIWDLSHLRKTGQTDLGGLSVKRLYISPDGQKIALAGVGVASHAKGLARALWVLKADGHKAITLSPVRHPTYLPSNHRTAWSPDARFLLVSWGGDDVALTLDTETGDVVYIPRPNMDPGADVHEAAWSPATPSRFLALNFRRSWESRGVYIFDVRQRRLWGDPEASDALDWHPGGRHLLTWRPGGLGLMDAEGQRVHILPMGEDILSAPLHQVIWSRDGRRVVTRHGSQLVLWDLVQRRMLDAFDLWATGLTTRLIQGCHQGILILGKVGWVVLGAA